MSDNSNSSSAVTHTLPTAADDFHVHLRDGAMLADTVRAAASQFQHCLIMPNLQPPVTTTELAVAYKQRITQAVQVRNTDSAQHTAPLHVL